MNTKHKLFVVLCALLTESSRSRPLWNDVCTQDDVKDLPFCDTTRDVEDRVDDLMDRIPVETQMDMMGNDAAGYGPLHLPPYQWWSEGLHGVLQSGPCFGTSPNGTGSSCATSFPCPSTLASSFDDTLFYRIASVIGKQGRAISNIRQHDASIGDGLTYWSPVVNLQRDPRWGRNQEVPGEDPLLTSRFAVQYIKGLQQVHYDEAHPTSQPLQVAACCKHFVANSLEKWQNYSRHDFNAIVSEQDLREYYYPPFAACIQQAGVSGIMCSYNAVNGIPSCVHQPLLQDLLRGQWGFAGYVTSDCGALEDVHSRHRYTQDPVQTAALALNATTNVNCGTVYQDYLPAALKQGLVSEESIRENSRTLIRVQMKLGLFDQPKNASRYGRLGVDDIDSPLDQQLAVEAAEQSVVLLQNRDPSTLPLKRGIKIAVIGPHVNATTAFLSNYRGRRCPAGRDEECVTTPLAAIATANTGGITVSALGCHVNGTWENIAEAKQVASSADAIVIVVGLDKTIENEGCDREETTLPGHQRDLAEAMLELNNPQTVLVMVSGGTLSLGPRLLETRAILQAGYGGQAAATALAHVLFGKYNPSGRLAATMYPPDFVNQMALTDMSLRHGVGRTHMFYQGPVEFSFGHGISYSQWTVQYEYAYDSQNSQLTLLATVTNQGPLPGRQSLLVLARRRSASATQARQKLLDYGSTRILSAKESETISLDINITAEDELVVLEPNGVQRKLGHWQEIVSGMMGHSGQQHSHQGQRLRDA